MVFCGTTLFNRHYSIEYHKIFINYEKTLFKKLHIFIPLWSKTKIEFFVKYRKFLKKISLVVFYHKFKVFLKIVIY